MNCFLACFAAYYYTNYRLAFQMTYRTLSTPSLSCQSTYIAQLNASLSTLSTALSSLCAGSTPPVTVAAAANINPVTVTAYSDGVSISSTCEGLCG